MKYGVLMRMRCCARFEGAQQLFASLKAKFLTLPDHVQVFPAHGAGSACGKALGALPSTTVGYERKYAWWSDYLKNDDEQGFIDELLDGQPDAHAYFARMKRQNKQGPAILGELPELEELDAGGVQATLAEGAVFADTRGVDEILAGTLPCALAFPSRGKVATHAGWAYDPESDDAALVLLAEDREDAHTMRDHMIRVGVDAAAAFTTSVDGLTLEPVPTVQADELRSRIEAGEVGAEQDTVLVDVRNKTEFSHGTVADARQLNAGKVLFHQEELPKDKTLVTFCQSGLRNIVAAQALRRAGFDVIELEGSYAAWQQS